MNPTLRVTEQGSTRWVTGEPTPVQPTALAKIDPDSVVRSALDAQSNAVQTYLRTVAGNAGQRTVDAAPRSPTGYSNGDELKARNRRFYFTVLAYVAMAIVVAYGLVQLAILADVLRDDWWLGAFLTLTGALALTLTFTTHRLEAHLTPEGIQATLAGADGYATERNADGQHAIATAVADAIRWRAESEYHDAQSRQLATEAQYGMISGGSASAPPRRLTMAAHPDDGMLAYGVNMPLEPSPGAQTGDSTPSYIARPVTPDSGCIAFLTAISGLYADARQRGDNLVTTRLPWSQRGDWSAAQKRMAVDVLQKIDPPLLLAGDGGRWRLNVAEWHEQIALQAVRRRWPH